MGENIGEWFGELTFSVNDSNPSFSDGRVTVVDRDYAYIGGGHGTHGLGIFDVSESQNPSFVSLTGDVTESGHAVLKSGDTVFLSGRFSASVEAFDVSDPSDPAILGSIADTDKYEGMLGFELAGDTLYAGIAGPNDPGVDNNPTALAAFDVSDATSLSEVSFVEAGVPGLYRPVREPGSNRLWASSYRAGELCKFDISEPTTPTLEATYDLSDYEDGRDIAISGSNLFLNDRSNGRVISVDISDPDNPTEQSVLSSANVNGGRDITITESGDYLLVGVRDNDRVTAVDIRDPTDLKLHDWYAVPEFDGPYGIAEREGIIYTSNAGDGVFNVLGPEDSL